MPLHEYFVHIDAEIQGKKCSVDIRNDAARVRHWVVTWNGASTANGHRGNEKPVWIKTVLATVKRVWLPAGKYVRRHGGPGVVWKPTTEPDNDKPWTMRIHVGFRCTCMPQLKALAQKLSASGNGDAAIVDCRVWWM